MLSAARCDECNATIPLRAPLASFALPPAAVTCPGCQRRIDTILLYRATWMEALVWKALALASVPLAFVMAWRHQPAAWWLFGTLLVSGIATFLLSRVLAFPLTLLSDRLRGIRSEP